MPISVQVTFGSYTPIRTVAPFSLVTTPTLFSIEQPFTSPDRHERRLILEGTDFVFAGTELISGTITSITYSDRFADNGHLFIAILGGTEHIDGLSLDAATFMSHYSAANWAAIDALLYSGQVIFRDFNDGSVFRSGDADDVMLGIFGDATYVTNGGNDYVFAGEADVDVIAGSGNDTVFGGNSYFFDAGVVDRVWAGSGDDFVSLGGGEDFASGDDGADYLYGDAGADTILAGAGDDIAQGGLGDDYIAGEGNRDVVFGDVGNDILSGGSEDDWLFAGEGNDRLFGDGGNDYLSGDAGNDIFAGGSGYNLLLLGAGSDVVQSTSGDGGVQYVYDFSLTDGDRIWLVGSLYASAADVLAAAVSIGGGTYIANGTDTVFLADITPSQLTVDQITLF